MGVGTATKYSQLLSTAAPPLLLTAILLTLQHTPPEVTPHIAKHLFRREDEAQCLIDLSSPDACSSIAQLCPDFDSDGLIPYLRLYTCSAAPARPFVVVAMAVWLVVLFASMATAASEFLAMHLQFIVQTVGINENVAGVTIFAFGNGCTDLFSTMAAMGANSGSLAISELFGAGAFITTVVLGLIAITQPFSVDPRSFVGDLIWFMIAASLLVAFLADGQLVLAECLGIIGLYGGFVLFALFRPKTSESFNAPATATEHSRHNADHVDAENDLLIMEPGETSTPASLDHDNSETETESDMKSPTGFGQGSPYIHRLMDSGSSHVPSMETQEMDEYGIFSDAAIEPVETESRIATIRPQWTQNFPPIRTWLEQSNGEKVLTIFCLPLLFPIGLTIPSLPSSENELEYQHVNAESSEALTETIGLFSTLHRSWLQLKAKVRWAWTQFGTPSISALAANWVLILQLLLGPQLFNLVIVSQTMSSSIGSSMLIGSTITLIVSMLLINYTFSSPQPGSGLVISVLGFLISLIWIFLTATSAVTLLMALAFILRIPTALLGATVFAVGQSSNDLVANTAVARRGMPVLAASATFGGPMMNMLLGIGGGGLVQVLKSRSAGGKGVYKFQAATGLFVSASCLLVGLGITLVWTFRKSWKLDKGLGIALIALWIVFTTINVALSFAQ